MNEVTLLATLPDLSSISPLLKPELMSLYALSLKIVKAQNVPYLRLPANITAIADDPLYALTLPCGRLDYREMMYDYDESGQLVLYPLKLTTAEVLDIIDEYIRPADRWVSVTFPLAWRVGHAMGFLSSLAVVQWAEAQAGYIILSSLVAPLLVRRSHR